MCRTYARLARLLAGLEDGKVGSVEKVPTYFRSSHSSIFPIENISVMYKFYKTD